jgi:hypothetical protein
MAIDVEHGGAVVFGVDDVAVEYFVVKGAGHGVLTEKLN